MNPSADFGSVSCGTRLILRWHRTTSLSSAKRINELGLSEDAERFAEKEIDVAALPLLIVP
jgi:hypothetical protein